MSKDLQYLRLVGNTPLISLKLKGFEHIDLEVKLEGYNPTGSVKDRAAAYILNKIKANNTINADTTIIESTSGNFGVALSAFCKHNNLRFIAVVDPNITSMNEMLIGAYGAEIIKVTKADANGGYLLTRIEKIHELMNTIPNTYWVNQYENPLNARAYYDSLGKEICFQAAHIDYAFLGVSSGGTITGVSRKIKENFPDCKIIAVDVEGSVIFNKPASKRYIPGIGSSMVPKILKEALIDDVIITNEWETINECYTLLRDHNIFAGGSSGSVIAGIKSYFSRMNISHPVNVVTVFPDRGERYFDTIFDKNWCDKIPKKNVQEAVLAG